MFKKIEKINQNRFTILVYCMSHVRYVFMIFKLHPNVYDSFNLRGMDFYLKGRVCGVFGKMQHYVKGG